MSFDALLDALAKYTDAVSIERSATEALNKLRVERDTAERVARTAVTASDEARNHLWAQVEALSGKRSDLFMISELKE